MGESSITRNFSKLLVGNLGVQLISFGFYPLLTRIYTPEEFGLFGFVNSLVVLFGIFSFGQMHTGLLKLKDQEKMADLFSACLWINFIFSLLLFLILGTAYLFGVLKGIYLLVPLGIVGYGSLEIHRNWSVAVQRFGLQTAINNFNRLSTNLFKLFGSTAIFLFVSEILSNLISVLFYGRYSSKNYFKFMSPKHAFVTAWNYREYWYFFTFYVLSQVLGSESIVIILKKYLSDAELGTYYLGNKLFIQTALILSSILSSAFNHSLNEGIENRIKIYKKSLLILLGGFSLGLVLSRFDYLPIMRFVLGDKWISLGEVVNYFILLTPFKIFVGFLAYILLLSGDLKFISIFKTIQFLILLGIIIQFPFAGLVGFLKIFVVFEVVMDLIFVLWGYLRVKRSK